MESMPIYQHSQMSETSFTTNDIQTIIESVFTELKNIKFQVLNLINSNKINEISQLQKIFDQKRTALIKYIKANKNQISIENQHLYDSILFD